MDNDFTLFPITDFDRVKKQLLNWANQFNSCCFLDNHQYQFQSSGYECIAGVNALHVLEHSSGSNALFHLEQFQKQFPGWLFGHLGYDLKNEIEPLHSDHPDGVDFPDLFFFVPEVVLQLNKQELSILSNGRLSPAEIFSSIIAASAEVPSNDTTSLLLQSKFSKEAYIESIERLKKHILRGDCYEINFCHEYFAREVVLDPLAIYYALSVASPNPFAAYYKINGRYMFCASPERYLKKSGDTIISQPIKGTSKRYLQDTSLDMQSRNSLFNSVKERSENVMVVDLVRNDLSKVCEEGSVVTDELFGIYSFPQVHQMISTIKGKLSKGRSMVDIIKATFPMGSMTGAPKIRVMELIEQYEKTKRGIFSGALGYVTPTGDFDFNVVIRSIFYNRLNQYLSFQVGSGITYYSNATDEYNECQLKAAAIKKVLTNAAP